MPFGRAEFLAVFGAYNSAVWPAQFALAGLAFVVVGLVIRGGAAASRVACAILAFLWAYMALAYHVAFFTAINPAAWVFAAIFAGGSVAFAWIGVAQGRVRLHLSGSRAGVAGAALVIYALALYPAWGHWAGQRYPDLPTFGLPCPTTIFTLGVLLCAQSPVPRVLLVVPVTWALVGTVAAVHLGIVQDYALAVAAVVAIGWAGAASASAAPIIGRQ